ncbi:DJ-1/PfpI family protein [Paenibacillus sp. SCIV0701]|uniref:DJ-1/PfpI family protein n=2 Tax=Paenibacillus soyae TaxID=2969249 RepID=A0A9X2S789_9BACL|nr:DJ-1/PfpI family protein [Paenibacillus soyae]
MRKSYKVGIWIYDGMDILDYAGPAEVLALTAYSRLQQTVLLYRRVLPKRTPFQVKTISEDGGMIKSHAGTLVQADYSVSTAPAFDILIVPGGPLRAVQKLIKSRAAMEYILSSSKQAEVICSVCSGALILAEAGLLDGKKATTHHLVFSYLSNKKRGIEVIKDKVAVKDGRIMTSGGVSSGIHMSLFLVETLFGKETALRTAKTIEYNSYHENGNLEVAEEE